MSQSPLEVIAESAGAVLQFRDPGLPGEKSLE
jgi:hypothetical protein